MATGVASWSTTAASNATADSAVDWSEGQSPSSVNDSARAMMASVAKARDDTSGTMISSAGSSNAYTATSNQVIASLQDGFRISFVANHTNTGAATLAVDGLTAKPLRVQTGTALVAGAIVSGSVYTASYESGNEEWLLHGWFGDQTLHPGIILAYGGNTAPTGYLLCYGQAISRTTYAALYNIFGGLHGAGDGATTFNLPDLRGRVIAGQDDMGGTSANRLTGQTGGVDGDTIGAVGGAETHVLTEAQLAAHTHTATVTDPGHTHSYTVRPNTAAMSDGGNNVSDDATTSTSTGSSTTGISVANSTTGSSSAHNNVQPTLILNYIVKI